MASRERRGSRDCKESSRNKGQKIMWNMYNNVSDPSLAKTYYEERIIAPFRARSSKASMEGKESRVSRVSKQSKESRKSRKSKESSEAKKKDLGWPSINN